MQFLTRPVIASKVVENLKGASEVSLAVAYFSPDQELMQTLRRIPQLTLVVSDEFAINDPYKLEVLSRSGTVRCVPADCPRGRLHAKVMITRQPSGQLFALVGSANLTWQGIFSNQEACVALASREASDLAVIGSVTNWFDTLLENSQTIDFPAAKRIFDARSQYTLEPRMVSSLHAVAKPSYWALKCTSGAYGKEHSQNF